MLNRALSASANCEACGLCLGGGCESPFALALTSFDRCGSKLPNLSQSGEASGFASY